MITVGNASDTVSPEVIVAGCPYVGHLAAALPKRRQPCAFFLASASYTATRLKDHLDLDIATPMTESSAPGLGRTSQMMATSRSQRKKLVADVVKLWPKHKPRPLKRYWTIGGKMMGLDPTYGDRQVSELAETVGCGQVILYESLRFRKLWPRKADLDRVVKRGLLFGHIRALSHSRLTPKQREVLERFVEKERPSIRAFRAKVRELIEKQPRPKKRLRYKDLGDM